MMLIKFQSSLFQNLLKLNEKISASYKNCIVLLLKCNFSINVKNIGGMNKWKEEITRHMQNEYNINADLLDTDLKIGKEEKNIYEISTIWSTFFKCDKSLYNVVSKYLKTNKTDFYLHNFLKSQYQTVDEINKQYDKKYERTEDGKNEDTSIMEEKVNHLLIYLMAMFYKNLRDFNTISLLTEKLINLLRVLQFNNQNKQLLFSICEVYNYLHVMNDDLFTLIFDKINNLYFNESNETINENRQMPIKDDEIILLLETLYNQKYKNHKIVDSIIQYLKNEKKFCLNPKIVVDVFFYLSLLNRLVSPLLTQLENKIFCIKKEEENREKELLETAKFFNKTDTTTELKNNSNDIDRTKEMKAAEIKIELTPNCCSKLLYAYFLLEESSQNLLFIHKLLQRLCKNVKDETSVKNEKKMHERICIIRSYLRYNKRFFYNELEKPIKKKLKEIYYYDIFSEKKINERNFVEKLSWHLKKLRIPHIKNIYKKGVVFDVIEKDKSLVWLCFSYHHYYVRTIDLTVEKILQMEIIKAMKYKIAKIHYYQFSRMKARKTRFEYIRMCRYYSLRDRRNFDEAEVEGWSLPYINWYHKKNKNVHVPNYFYNYTPLSEVEY